MSLPGRPEPHAGAEEGADQGTILMALLVTLVAMAMSATLVPIVISQIATSRTISARTMALDAAQAGIDVALGQLRSAVDAATGKGSLEALPPCAMTGTVGATGLRYRVTISYFGLTDPTDPGTAVPLTCPPVDVPYSASLSATGGGPLVASLAAGSAGTRTIDATYTFKTTNENVTGGAIQLAAPAVNPLCMDAGTIASPPTGTHVTMQRCVLGGTSSQRFAYTSDLSIMLVGSERTGALLGMCLEAPVPHAAGGLVTFQPCLARVARQQWSLDDSSQFRGTTDGVKLDGFCLSVKVPDNNPGSDVVVGSCNTGANQTTFRPQTGVGAGMASAVTNQLVNYKQFSRCLDVTNQVATSSYMIVWFCKQAPDGGVTWNQQWTYPPLTTTADNATPERIRTTGTNNPGYCLLTPGSTLAGKYVTMTPCTPTGILTDERLKWTVYGDTGNYATSYRIVDSYGYCLVPTDLTVANPDTHSDGTSKVKVAACNNSELQKWNAPANFNKPLVLTNTRER
jgi:hypothetical protein